MSRPSRRVALARPGRQRSRCVLEGVVAALGRPCQSAGDALPSCTRPAAADRRRCSPRSSTSSPPRSPRGAGARRLPRHRADRGRTRRGLPARPPAAAAHIVITTPGRPAAAARPAAGAGRAGRDPSGRPAVHRRRGGGVPHDGMGLHLDRGARRRPRGPDRGMDRGPPARCPVARRARRRREFIEGFAGDDRYVVDYLVEEVLQRQPEDVRGSCSRPRSWTG